MEENLLLPRDLLEHKKDKISKYMTSISKHSYIDKLDDIVNKYNNMNHRKIKIMKLTDPKSSIYIESNVKDSDNYPTFNVTGDIRIPKYKNIFAKQTKFV